ncbi:BON domain-containing protein, partial [Leptospira weilii]
ITVNVATNGTGVATSAAHQIKLAAEAVSNIAGVTKIVDVIEVANAGSGVVSAFTQTALGYERYMEITSADDLLELGFLSTDKEYIQATKIFRQTPRPKTVAVYLLTAWANAAAEIAALRNTGKDAWFKTIATTHIKSEICALGDYLASIEKMYFACTDDLTTLVGRNSIWEYITLHKNPDSFPEAAWVGNTAPRRVGSYNYAYLPLDGVENSGYTDSQTSSIFSDKG